MMNGATSMFVLSEGGLVPLQPTTFATEAEFQALLAEHPALLAGDQIDSTSPRRFLLIDREQPIACEQNGPARWALDHLFLDQDGEMIFADAVTFGEVSERQCHI
jgi:hypothetical protein